MIADALWSDLRCVLRRLRRSQQFSFIVIIVLALGFGLSIAIFSTVRSVLLAPLPYKDSDHLVQVISRWTKTGDQNSWSAPFRDAVDWKTTVPDFQDVAMYRYNLFNLTEGGSAEALYGLRVTANLLPMLGVRPQLGEWFPAEYDQPGNNHVALLSDDLWRRRFHADPGIVGKTIHFDGEGFQVLGVMPKGFNFPLRLATTAQLPTDQMQYWIPLAANLAQEHHGDANAGVIARLQSGTSLTRAQAQLEAACLQLQQEFPDTNKDLSARLLLLRQQTVTQVNMPLLALLAATALTLLLACANVVGLLLANGEAHVSELAVRMALGGSRLRIAFLPMLQGLLLCVLGGLVGVPCAFVSLKLLLRLTPIDVPRLAGTHIDPQALVFGALLVLFTGLFVGGLNAMQVLKRSPREVLSESSRNTPGQSRARLRSSLVITQTALAVILMSSAGLMLRTFVNLLSTDIGYRPDHVLYAVNVLPFSRYPTREARDLFYKKVLDRLRAAPTIQYAAASTGFPLVGEYDGVKVQTADSPIGDAGSTIIGDLNDVSPGYLEAVGVRLLQGRFIREEDTADSPKIAVIDNTLAHQLWPEQDPIGKLIKTDADGKPAWRQIVGIIAPVRNRSLDVAGRPNVFLPASQTSGYDNFLVVKSSASPTETARLLQTIVSSTDPDQAVFFSQSMRDLIEDSITTRRFLFIALSVFAAAALILSVLGVYGIVSFIAARRVREVGIRMALGATPWSIVRLVLSQGARLVVLGVVAGLGASFVLNRFLSGLLFGVHVFDVETLGLAIAIMGVGTIIAAFLPAWRAAKLDPMQALRTE